jgi:phosphoribosylaminoimidazole (AIR) synthetase
VSLNRPPIVEKELLYKHNEEIEEEEDQHYYTTMLKKQQRYVDWINNQHIKHKVNSINDVCTGESLLELLERLSQKEIMRPMTNPTQSMNVQRMDRVIAAFKFMGVEGIELDGLCTVRGSYSYIYIDIYMEKEN